MVYVSNQKIFKGLQKMKKHDDLLPLLLALIILLILGVIDLRMMLNKKFNELDQKWNQYFGPITPDYNIYEEPQDGRTE